MPAVVEHFPDLAAARAGVQEGNSVLANHWCASVDATIDLRTGCNPLEKHGPQAVIVHADAWAPVDVVADPHDIRQVIDYEVIFLAIRKLEGNPHSICLETSILEVMDAIFSMAISTTAFVSMHKPHVHNGQERRRSRWR
ncbi:MAG: dihydroneopterin aldolase [Dechloromonas sp.]|uniref:Dihydroneopterin aldolase n=1 Tax=Candidatus Dechloromonas phosphorivorans TaxID=2899244 RepID=A0A9D7QHQ2_9RHOO|nr:dihydroneopterin aldolase [Candidatus Dechloromonas phosphorivorans]